MNKFLKYWLPVILWAGLIFTLSAIPNLKSDLPSSWDLVLRKIAHATEYAILTMLLYRAFAQHHYTMWFEMIPVFIVGVLYAVSDEIHQLSVLGRHGSLWDVGIDMIGVIAGILLYYFLRKKKKADPEDF